MFFVGCWLLFLFGVCFQLCFLLAVGCSLCRVKDKNEEEYLVAIFTIITIYKTIQSIDHDTIIDILRFPFIFVNRCDCGKNDNQILIFILVFNMIQPAANNQQKA